MVCRPQHCGYSLDHHSKPGTFFFPLGLDLLKVRKHAIDGIREVRQLILTGNVEPGREVAARSDLGDVVAQRRHAGGYEPLEQVNGHCAENESRREQEQKELDHAVLTLQINLALKKNAQNERWLTEDVVHLSICGQLAPRIRLDDDRLPPIERVRSGAKLGWETA